MAITNTWAIANLERNVADGKITTIHWTLNSTDGTYNAGCYGSIGVDGAITIQYKDLTADTVIDWVKDHFGAEKVTEILQSMADQLEQQRAPKTAAGVPW
jgi:hypothetical protein